MLPGCGEKAGRLVEAGQWVDRSVPALFIIYHLDGDIPEAGLKEKLKPLARKHAGKYGFVIQIAVRDADYARKLASPETKALHDRGEFQVGSEILTGPDAKVQGGMVHTYFREGDYDEWIYWPRL
jgi:hypothetical protein